MTLKEYILKVFLPSTTILIYGIKTSRQLSKQVDKNESLGNSKFDNMSLSAINTNTCRKYQDAIFVYNRKNSILTPDWLYWLRRKKDDEKMIEVNQMLSRKFEAL